ncbi:hypothetical protein F4824DRAFT_202094 [Ustulina deusta]|nr:hypothetical protein F4824DRAFT_202094 [Ustulina deusta]
MRNVSLAEVTSSTSQCLQPQRQSSMLAFFSLHRRKRRKSATDSSIRRKCSKPLDPTSVLLCLSVHGSISLEVSAPLRPAAVAVAEHGGPAAEAALLTWVVPSFLRLLGFRATLPRSLQSCPWCGRGVDGFGVWPGGGMANGWFHVSSRAVCIPGCLVGAAR